MIEKISNQPSHLHLASIMAESCNSSSQFLQEIKGNSNDVFDEVISKFIATEQFYEVVCEILEKAKDRQAIQYAKFQAAIDHQVFYTDL